MQRCVALTAPHSKQLLSAVPRAARRRDAASFHHGEKLIFIHARQIVSALQGRKRRGMKRQNALEFVLQTVKM